MDYYDRISKKILIPSRIPKNHPFFSHVVPDIDIEDYINRISKYCFKDDYKDKDIIYEFSLSYINRLSVEVNYATAYNIIFTSILLAIKYLFDDHYSNKYYSVVGGLSLNDLNDFELKMLKMLNWDVSFHE